MRTHLAEAFHLHQLNHDEIPDTPEELRTRNARIVQLCEWAEDLLEDRTARPRRGHRPRAPRPRDHRRSAGGCRSACATRIPQARETVAAPGGALLRRRAASRSTRTPPRPSSCSASPSTARRSPSGAARPVSASRRTSRSRPRPRPCVAPTTLLDAVETFEVEALRAESTLSAIVEDSRGDLVVARTAPQVPAVTAAMAELEAALRALPAAGVNTDPFALLTRLREANGGLDDAIAVARERAARPIPPLEHVRHAIDDADRQLAVTRDVIAGHRGWIGADARTRLAEAERIRVDLDRFLGTSASAATDDRRGPARTGAGDGASRRRSSRTRGCSSRSATSTPSRPQERRPVGPEPGLGRRRPRRHGGGMGGILGGLVIGSLLGDIFDG